MKKLLAMTMALALVLAMSVPAFAAEFGDIDDVYFDDRLVIEFTLEDLIRMAEEAGVADAQEHPFTPEDLQFRVTLGSDYVKLTQKTFDDTAESGGTAEGQAAAIRGKGVRITLTPVDDYTVSDREVRFEYHFLRSHSGKVVKTEAVKGEFRIVRRDLTKGEIGVLAGEKAPVYLGEDTDIISADRFAEGTGKSINILSPDGAWKLGIKNISENQKGINVSFNTVADDNITEAFPEALFQCVNFLSPSAVLATCAVLELELDADALELKGPDQRVWLYTFDGKTMTLEGAQTVNVYEHRLTVAFELDGKTALGSYYVSDTELKGSVPAADGEGSQSSVDGTDEGTNPNTGASDNVGAAVAIAALALITAGAVSVRRFGK